MSLEGFSRAFDAAAARREERRVEFNKKLGEPILWLPYEDNSEQGVGWFRGDIGFIAYRKYANGYDPYSRTVLEDSLIRALLPFLP